MGQTDRPNRLPDKTRPTVGEPDAAHKRGSPARIAPLQHDPETPKPGSANSGTGSKRQLGAGLRMEQAPDVTHRAHYR